MLATSHWSVGDVGHVNAHATGSIAGDAIEAQAIRNILGDVPVTAPKSFFGNLGAAGGALEMAASVLALSRGLVPVTLNYAHPDPACPVNVVAGAPQQIATATAAVLNQSNAGQTVCVGIAR
jgi:3-oxoacyl-[acyl-carrier-protein] synthase II